MKRLISAVAGAGSVVLAEAAVVHAEWTPLITADDFTGIQTDVMTAVGGVISVVLIIIGATYLVRALVK